jgi:hypothetical protein
MCAGLIGLRRDVVTRASIHTVGLLAMHHIYSSEKKQCIETFAPQHDLTGWYLYGKPGFVVVEGRAESVGTYIRKIRRLRWQMCMPMGRIARVHVVDGTLPPWAQPQDLKSLVPVPLEHYLVHAPRSNPEASSHDGVEAHVPFLASQRLWNTFLQADSPNELEAQLRVSGLSVAWTLLNQGFRHAKVPPPLQFTDPGTTGL